MSRKLFLIIFLFVVNIGANERIISLSPSITEIVYALGAGDEMVATSSYSLFPKKAQRLPIIGDATNQNIEKIISFFPSLVVGETFNINALNKLKMLNIKTVMVKLQTIDDIKNSISILGRYLGKNKQALKLTDKITNAIKNAPKSKKPHSILIVYGLSEDLRSGIYVAGSNIFFDDIIKLSGNTNAYKNTKVEQAVLSYENVIALNPDQIIILHSHATESKVNVKKALKAWYSLPTNAAKNSKISIVDENYLDIPSDRIAFSITRLAREMND